jgi:hypothetical protein
VEAPGVEPGLAMLVSIGLDRFQTVLPSLTAKKWQARYPACSVSNRLQVEK